MTADMNSTLANAVAIDTIQYVPNRATANKNIKNITKMMYNIFNNFMIFSTHI